MRVCFDVGPTENLHRFRGIGWCTRYLTAALTPALAQKHRVGISLLARGGGASRQTGFPTGACVTATLRSRTAEWTGIDRRVPEPIAEAWKVVETATVLPRDVRSSGAEVFVATDPQAIALSRSFRTVAFLYDLIPLLYPEHYLPRIAVVGRRTYANGLRRLRRAHHLIAISEATKADAIRMLGIESERISVAPLAVDTSIFAPVSADVARNYVREKHGLDRPFFFYVGGFDHRKNIPTLVAATERLPDPIQLAIAGPMKGPGHRVRRSLQGVSSPGRVVWMDYVPTADLPYLYASSLGLVFPSLHEGFGLTVLEAMSTGAPVITSRLSSIPEVAGEAALYVDPTSVEQLAAAMRRLAEDDELRSELRKRGFMQAGRFSWTRTADRVLEIARAAGEGRSPE